MNLIELIEQDFLESGADSESAEFAKKLAATYAKDAKQLCVDFPELLERLRNSSPMDESVTLSGILEALPSAVEAESNFVLYRALCRLVALKLPANSRECLSQLAEAIASQARIGQKGDTAVRELIYESVLGSLGSLHPSVSQSHEVKRFLITPFLVDYPEALAELVFRNGVR